MIVADGPGGEPAIELSIVVPVLNEKDSLRELLSEVREALEGQATSFEIVLVDDGSTDGTTRLMEQLATESDHVIAVVLRRNFGKAEALVAGFRETRGRVVITMDGDLQDCPSEIPKLLGKLNEGYDLVSGWKRDRKDPIGKTLPSKLFNLVTSGLTGVYLHDHNCGFKAYRREVVQELRPYGELHRFMPVLAHRRGFRVAEVPVEHRARVHGKSKYGGKRLLSGFLDLLTVIVTVLYDARPLHVFGSLGLLSMLAGFVSAAYLTALWLLGKGPIGTRPLLSFAVLALLFGAQLMFFGLLAEIVIRSREQPPPPVRRVVR